MQFKVGWFIDLVTNLDNKLVYEALEVHNKLFINPLAPELFFFLISAHPVYKMWIIQELNKLPLWNKLHFEEKKTESIEHV